MQAGCGSRLFSFRLKVIFRIFSKSSARIRGGSFIRMFYCIFPESDPAVVGDILDALSS